MPGAVEQCLSVVMPCYNEEQTLKVVVERVLESPFTRELIIVDDGSRDRSIEIARSIADPRVRVVAQPTNLGKGAAIRRGFAEATSPYVLVQDADLEYDPNDYVELLEPLRDGRADVVYGSRFLAGRPHRVLYFWHAVGNRVLTTASNMFSNLNLSDMETCYKVFRREVLDELGLREDGFGIEAELTAKVAKGPWRIYEVGISYAGRTYAEGKKIGWKDGVWAFYCIVRYSRAWDRVFPPARRRTASIAEADSELASALDTLGEGLNYTEWIYSMMEPYLGRRVLEVGAGHGTITEQIAPGREVVATEITTRAAQRLRERFATDPRVQVIEGIATRDNVGGDFDSAVLVNVLEHIEDDVGTLAQLAAMLRPGGHVILYVPAFAALYSDFDAKIGHHRRYRRSELAAAVGAAGMEIETIHYVNSVGAAAWWLFAKQMRQTPTQGWAVRVYDRLAVPVLRRRESQRAPRFGQSLFCVARRPADS
jgi:glycosyltransferase involved in cell wall biosynthesis/precorrin-6B methylase 2